MSTPDRDTVDNVEKLLADRQKVARWLAALEQKQAVAPSAVFQKVREDYVAKLDKVQAKLVAASDAIQVAAADLAARLTDKEEAFAKKRDERAEAELRFDVGEFSEKEWERRRSRLDEEISVVTGERDTMLNELRRLRDVLADVAGHGPSQRESAPDEMAEALVEAAASTAAAESAVEPTEAPMDVAGFIEAATVEPSSPIEAVVPAPPAIPIHEQSIIAPVDPPQPLAPSFDELAFLKSVVGRSTPAAPAHPMEPAMVPKRPAGEPKHGSGESKRAAAPTPVNPVAQQAPQPKEYEVPEPPMPFPDPVPEPRVSQEMTPPRESFFGRPTPRTSEAVKSLRCQECGTLNFPTEWYCERCGGELAAF
jgi:hypothetical protein